MKNLKKTRVMLACAVLALACTARGVETKCLDGMWEFAFAEGKPLAEAKPDFVATDRMPVPGCYDLVPGYYMKRGTGLYCREFTLARGVPGARVRVKGMGLRMKLWLDGREIGTSKLVFSDLEFQTGPLAAGRHTLAAALDNRLFNANNEMFQPYYDYVASGGFYHGVELRLQSLPVEIDRVLVRNRDYKTGRVELELCVRNAADGTSVADVVREAQVSFDGGAPATVRFTNGRAEMSVPNFRLWSPETPHLHSVRVAAEGFGAAEARFGVRQFTCGKGKFWLNGSPVFLKGVNRHDSDYANGYATSRISMWRDLKLIKGLGANFVRTSHYPPSDEFLSLCDEIGLLVWQECIGWQNNPAQMSNPEFIALQLEQAHLMARSTINHPSAVIDAFLNEFKSTSREGRDLAAKMVDALHSEDTGRPVSYATCRYVKELANDKTDFIAFNLYPSWHQEIGTATTHEGLSSTVRRRFREVAQVYRDRFGPDKPIMIGETGCYSFYGQHDPEGAQWSEEFQAEYLSNSVDFAIKDKDIQGVAVWQFCDSRSYFRGGSDIRTRPLGCNMVGLFDIHRREKLAAKAVRKLFLPSAK